VNFETNQNFFWILVGGKSYDGKKRKKGERFLA